MQIGNVATTAGQVLPASQEVFGYLPSFSEAILRINESRDLATVRARAISSARLLAAARYGVMVVLGHNGQVENLLPSGFTSGEFRGFRDILGKESVFEYLGGLTAPLRVEDIAAHVRLLGLSEFLPPVPMCSFMAVPVCSGDQVSAWICLAQSEPDRRFTAEDETVLAMFAAQSALAMTNALNYQRERQAQTDHEAIVDISPVGIWVFDARTRKLTALNREARRISGHQYGCGMTLDEVRNERGLRYWDGRDVPVDERPVSRVIRNGERIHAEELVLVRPDGLSFPGLFSAAPLYAADGSISHVVLTVEDMRPREELQRLRAEFLGMVSHELRTPLTSIKGSAVSLLGGADPLDSVGARHFLQIIDQQADRMRGLIDALLDLTRIEAGQLSIHPEPADMGEIVAQARGVFLSRGPGASVSVDCPAGLPRVRVDRQRLAQVLDNLLSNAARFSAEQPVIRVAVTHRDADCLEVSVTGHGRGILPEDLYRVFAKFFRADHSEPAGDGHGLGLAICKGIVEAHGGRIWVESGSSGHGARFTFTLPVFDDAAHAGAVAQEPLDRLKAAKILVVDDDPQILRYLAHVLTEASYVPVVTDDPRRVEELLATERPQLVLLDLVSSGSDAFELLERTPALWEVPVVFLSGNSGDSNIVRALEMGACDYIVKPFSAAELVARIRAAMRRQPASHGADAVPQTYRLGELSIDFSARTVTVAGAPAHLTPTEYQLICELAGNAGRVLTHRQLLERVWGPEYADGDAGLLRVFVGTLRRKLGDTARDSSYILTEPRVGYRMAPGEIV